MNKIHKANPKPGKMVLCGRSNVSSCDMTYKWKYVTCKHCLTHMGIAWSEPISLEKEKKALDNKPLEDLRPGYISVGTADRICKGEKVHMAITSKGNGNMCHAGASDPILTTKWDQVTCKICLRGCPEPHRLIKEDTVHAIKKDGNVPGSPCKVFCGEEYNGRRSSDDWANVTCKRCLKHKDTLRDIKTNKPVPKIHKKMQTCNQAVCRIGLQDKIKTHDWSQVTCKSCLKAKDIQDLPTGADLLRNEKQAKKQKFDGRLDRPDKCTHIIPELVHKLEGLHALCGVSGGKGTYDRNDRVTCTLCLELMRKATVPPMVHKSAHQQNGTPQTACNKSELSDTRSGEWKDVTCLACLDKMSVLIKQIAHLPNPKDEGKTSLCGYGASLDNHKIVNDWYACTCEACNDTVQQAMVDACTKECLKDIQQESLKPDYLAKAMIKASDVDGALTDIIENVPWLKKSTLLMMMGLQSITQEMRSYLRKHKEQQEKNHE